MSTIKLDGTATVPVKMMVTDTNGDPVTSGTAVDVPLSVAVATSAAAAIKAKTEIAALTAASTAADIVAALKA